MGLYGTFLHVQAILVLMLLAFNTQRKTTALIWYSNEGLKHQDLQMLGHKLFFTHLKLGGRGSETQLQVGEKLNYVTVRVKPVYVISLLNMLNMVLPLT